MVSTEVSMPSPISVLIVEDEPIFISGIRAVLAPYADLVAIVGEAKTAEAAVVQTADLVPDVAVVDLRLPRFAGDAVLSWEHGVHAITQMKQVSPTIRLLVLSYLYEADILFSALKAGAHGYITKGDRFDGKGLAQAIVQIAAGETIFGPTVAQLIREDAQHVEDPLEQLTPRECEVLELLIQRKANREIAKQLVISEKTVKTHVSNILAKRQIKRREEIVWQHQAYERRHTR